MQKYTFNVKLKGFTGSNLQLRILGFGGSDNQKNELDTVDINQKPIVIDFDSQYLVFEVLDGKRELGISSVKLTCNGEYIPACVIPHNGTSIGGNQVIVTALDLKGGHEFNLNLTLNSAAQASPTMSEPISDEFSQARRAEMTSEPTDVPTKPANVQRVMLSRTEEDSTPDEYLWYAIEERTRAIGFDAYSDFLNRVFCEKGSKQELNLEISKQGCSDPTQGLTYYGTQAYELLKDATDCFLMQECGTVAGGWQEKSELSLNEITEYRNNYLVELAGMDGQRTLPYFNIIREKLAGVPIKSPQSMIVGEEGSNESSIDSGICYGILPSRMSSPCMTELIWSYWMEEMGLKQAWNLISLRFQNRKVPGTIKLARMEMDPLRPLNNLLWGYVQHEGRRLTIPRRAAEYMHAYGLPLKGKAIANLHFSDTRKSFLQAFHTLLNLCHGYYMQDDDATIHADAFPVLNGLREVHLLLAEGLHNQAMDLTWTARAEAMMEQWMMTLPPMRDFLGGRVMVPYSEPWMDRMDTMKNLMDWNQTPSSHFRDLAVYGEQILLSVRFGNWTEHNDAAFAANWLKYWRSAIQRYMHAYRAVTGVDLTRDGKINATPPAELIEQRMAEMKPAA